MSRDEDVNLKRAEDMARILVVDDNERLTKMLDFMFSSKGHQVSVADSGSKALSMIDAEAPDLMLLDMVLPDIDGMAVLRKLKTSDRQFPVILLSAISDPEVIKQAMKMGAAGHCSKPFTASDLYSKVMHCLAASGNANESRAEGSSEGITAE